MTLAGRPLDVFIPISDAGRARRFYEGGLGLTALEETPFALVFDAPGGAVRLAKTPGFAPQPFTVAGWSVDDLEADMAVLAARGIVFERFGGLLQDDVGVWTTPDGAKVCWFKDPDGNILSLSQQPG